MNSNPPLITRDPDGQIHVSAALRNGLIGLFAVYGVFLLIWPGLTIPLWGAGRIVWPAANAQVAEAEAWLHGTMALSERMWDTAVYAGRVFCHFPPFMTFVSVVVLATGLEGVPFNVLSALFVLPIPGLAYWLFLKRCDRVWAAVVLASMFVLGTSEFMVLCRTLQAGKPWQLNHAISQAGLLLFLIDYFGAKRVWLGGIGLMIATWSRATMAVYCLPLLWMAYACGEGSRRRRMVRASVAIAVLLAVPMTLNTLKFGNPLNAGYSLIYVGRDDAIARDARIGIFSLHFVPRNLYSMNLGFPKWKEHGDERRLVADRDGTGIWWTTPLLMLLFVDLRKILRRPENRVLMVSVGIVYVALMTFHTTGAAQNGYNRFSLDFLLPLLAMIAPLAFVGRRKYVTIPMVIWSVVYFASDWSWIHGA